MIESRTPLAILMALIVGLAAMPLDIFAFNRQAVGIQRLSPWERGRSSLSACAGSMWRRLTAFCRTPRCWQITAATAVMALMLTGHLHAHPGQVLIAGLTAAEFREKANKLGTDMKALLDKAKAENRDLAAEEGIEFDKMDVDRETALAGERRLLRAEELEQGQGRRTDPSRPTGDTAVRFAEGELEKAAEEHNNALRAWFASQLGIPLTRQQEELCKRQGINTASRSIGLRRPSRPLSAVSAEGERQWTQRALALIRARAEQRAISTLSTTSPEDGSYLIANEAMQPLERAMLAYGGVRQVSTVLRTRTGANLPIPTSDDTSNEGALLAENTQAVEKDTEFGQLVLGAFKFTSKKVLVSRELFQDSNEDLGAFMFTALGERLARALNRYATTGSGSSQPNGVVTAATSSAIALGAKTPTYLELVAIEATVDPAYRVGASWMFHDTMLQEIKKIVDTTGRPIWMPNMTGGAPDAILSYPYSINQHMDAAAATGSGKSILFGNMKKYLYREVQDIEVMRLNELYAEYYQVAFVAFARMDGDLLDAGTHPVKYAANHS